MKREKTVSGKLLLITESQPSLFVRGLNFLVSRGELRNSGEGSKPASTFRFSGIHRCCFGRSELLFQQLCLKLYPSLKFLSSFNSPRNFFSPSRGEIKMFRLIKSKIFFIFLNNSNRKRLCLFASIPLGILNNHPHINNRTSHQCMK